MKIALVHDYLTQFGGGERVLKALCEVFPEAPIFTLIYDEKTTHGIFKGIKIHTSFLQRLIFSEKVFRSLAWLAPLAIEQFDLSPPDGGFDVVISVSHSFSKGIITKPGTRHICYCLTPPRYLWHDAQESLKNFKKFNLPLVFKPLSTLFLTYLRVWDFQAAQRVDYFIACSENVKQRIKKYYGRESEVIYPPVEIPSRESPVRSFSGAPAAPSDGVGRFASLRSDQAKTASESAHWTFPAQFIKAGYFLMVGRMVPYKRFDLAIEAFSKLPEEKLLIIGDGPEYKRLKAKSLKFKVKNIKFLGQISDSELPKYYANCKALIFPQEEDFGIVPIEAMASGRPVIAFRMGGALETVVEGRTGVFFNEQTPNSLRAVILNFNEIKFNSENITKHSFKFNEKIFKSKIAELVSLFDISNKKL